MGRFGVRGRVLVESGEDFLGERFDRSLERVAGWGIQGGPSRISSITVDGQVPNVAVRSAAGRIATADLLRDVDVGDSRTPAGDCRVAGDAVNTCIVFRLIEYCLVKRQVHVCYVAAEACLLLRRQGTWDMGGWRVER